MYYLSTEIKNFEIVPNLKLSIEDCVIVPLGRFILVNMRLIKSTHSFNPLLFNDGGFWLGFFGTLQSKSEIQSNILLLHVLLFSKNMHSITQMYFDASAKLEYI
jgi:hypothetical protein